MTARIIITGRNNTVPNWAFSGLPNSGTKPGSVAGGTRHLPSSQREAPGNLPQDPSPGATRGKVR